MDQQVSVSPEHGVAGQQIYEAGKIDTTLPAATSLPHVLSNWVFAREFADVLHSPHDGLVVQVERAASSVRDTGAAIDAAAATGAQVDQGLANEQRRAVFDSIVTKLDQPL